MLFKLLRKLIKDYSNKKRKLITNKNKKTMSNLTTKQYFAQDGVKKKFEELLGKRSSQFITSVLQIVNNNKLLSQASPESIYNSCTMAATLNLPINQNLGFAWIVPYKGQAQFQMGWKGFVQLSHRTGQYLRINVVEVYENQFKSFNNLTEDLDADFSIDGVGEIVGYCCYFKLLNGFEKTTCWSKLKVNNHALKYSQAYKSANGMTPWKDAEQFHEMAKKTVLKNTLSKWGILSIEIENAITTDQAVIKDATTLDVSYVDNTDFVVDKETQRISLMLEDCKTIKSVNELRDMLIAEQHVLTVEQSDMFSYRVESLRVETEVKNGN